MDFQQTLIIAVITALLSGGGLAGLIAWLGNRKKIQADITVSISGEWQKLYKEMEARLGKVEERHETLEGDYAALSKKYEDLKGEMEILREENEHLTAENERKEEVIQGLTKEVGTLTERISRYEGMSQRADEAKEILHETVDKGIAKIKDPNVEVKP